MTEGKETIKIPTAEPKTWLERTLFSRITPALLILALIVLISLGFHLHNLEAIGDGNTYYTAAVEAMLDSWSNFFFVAAEPGGSVTVDKPPLGLWIEAAFAYVFGVNGIVVSMPNILAGLLSIPLMYYLVKKHLGAGAGLTAAAVTAFTPVVFAADRNNTMDSMLTFTLLLAAWAFIEATEQGKLRYLLLGGFIVGLGFNIKMMQAFLPLPAFFALYFFASKQGWGRKLINLGLTTLMIAAVSLSWVVAVDTVPADQRPYIGSSTDNTVMELIVGHNGLNRLFGGNRTRQTDRNADDGQLSGNFQSPQDDGGQTLPPLGQNGQRPAGPPNSSQVGQGSGEMFSDEIGAPGVWRFFESELANESSWMLPFALVSVVLGVFSAKMHMPIEASRHKALVLWGGWLLTCMIFFSVAAFFHAYYLVMVAPALGGSAAIGWAVLDEWRKSKPVLAGMWLVAVGGLTLGIQVYLTGLYGVSSWMVWLAGLTCAVGMVIAFAGMKLERLRIASMWIMMAGLLTIPLIWSFLTVDIESPNINLPSAYAGANDQRANQPRNGRETSNELVDYLVSNQTGEYLVAVPSSNQGANIVLETGKPVLYMGGFNGSDPVVDVVDLAEMVSAGDLTYVLYGTTTRRSPEQQNGIAQWLQKSCTLLPQFSQVNRIGLSVQPAARNQGGMALYECDP